MKSIKLKIVLLIVIVSAGLSFGIGMFSDLVASKELKANVNDFMPEVAKQGTLVVEESLQKEWNVLETIALNEVIADPTVSLADKCGIFKA